MSNEQNAKALPTHRVYSVARNGDKKAIWQEIGAAWPHKDGKGFNLTFAARPLEGAQIVLRVATAKTESVVAEKTESVASTRRTGGRYAKLGAAATEACA